MTAELPAGACRRRGRPPCCSRELAECIVRMRLKGLSYGQICIALNAKRIPTPMGGSLWQKAHVYRLLRTDYVRRIAAEIERASPVA